MTNRMSVRLTVLKNSSSVARRAGEQREKECSELFWRIITLKMDKDSGLQYGRGKSGAQSIYS